MKVAILATLAIVALFPAGPPSPAQPGQSGITILFHSDPQSLRVGKTKFEVMVKEGKKSVKDADVSLQFDRSALSDAPDVKSKITLKHYADGIYRGSGLITAPGNWNVMIVVRRGGQQIGTRQLTLTSN
jgi:hypothetical protein